MGEFSFRMKLVFTLIFGMYFFGVFNDEILTLFHLQIEGKWELTLSAFSFFIEIMLIAWAFSLGKIVIQGYSENEKHYKDLIDLSPEAIFVLRAGKIIFTNNAGVAFLEANSIDDILNHKWKDIFKVNSKLEHQKTKFETNKRHTFQIEVKFPNGKLMDLEITSTNIKFDGLPAKELIVRDITSRKEQERIAKKLIYQDTLTQLPNRRAFLDKLEQSLTDSKKNNNEFAVMFIDLDRFKKVNDTMGHDIGDELLKTVGTLIEKCIRKNDLVARLGGDEFTVLLPNANQVDCIIVAKRIINALNSPITIKGEEIRVTPSIGISLYPHNAKDASTLLKQADKAMYQTKRNGKNGYRFINNSD